MTARTYARKKKFIEKNFQTKLSVDIIIIAVVAATLIGGLTYFFDTVFSSKIISEFIPAESYELYLEKLAQHSHMSFMLIVAISTVGAVAIGIAGVYISHRAVGPFVRFKYALDSLLEGKIPSQVSLRANDCGEDVAERFNMLFALMRDNLDADAKQLIGIQQELEKHPQAQSDENIKKAIETCKTMADEKMRQINNS